MLYEVSENEVNEKISVIRVLILMSFLCYVTAFRRRENVKFLSAERQQHVEIGRTRPVVFIGDEKKLTYKKYSSGGEKRITSL